jgi:hypothetical protein
MKTTDTQTRRSEALRLFEHAAAGTSVPLVVLTDQEECVLANGEWALFDLDAWLRWTAMPAPYRADAVDAVRASLRDRGYLAESGSSAGSVPLGLVTAARRVPYFVVVTLDGAAGGALPCPLLYGVVDDAAGLRGVVVELRANGVHDYRLLSPRRAAEGLVSWASRAVPSDGDARRGERESVLIEVLRHRVGEPMAAAAVVVRRGSVASLRFDGSRVRCERGDLPGMVTMVERLLRDAAERTPVDVGSVTSDG